jgi:gamma-glutamyl hydrolase
LERLDNQDYTTAAPLIGVLTQPHFHKHHKEDQTISGPLVSWVESAGGRVVPINYNAPWEQIETIFKSINGLVLPGGSGELWYGHPFFDTAAKLLQLARDTNDDGVIFPVFGICLGFETLHIILANQTREDLLVPSKGQESVANTLELTDEADSSLFFSRWTEAVMDQVADEKLQPTFNAHEWAVPLTAYNDNKILRNQLNILSTSKDTAGELYVSTVEGRHYPFLATQWHPEKPPYEFSDGTIPHTRTAIDAASLTASLLIDVARLNSHSVEYSEQVKLVIDNYDRHFIAAEGSLDEDDPLPDTLWFVPQPKNARTDPETEYDVYYNGSSFSGVDTDDDVVVGFKGERNVQLTSASA